MLRLMELDEQSKPAEQQDISPIRLEQIRRIDAWRIEWGFEPYEKAVLAFRNSYQAGGLTAAIKDVRSVYKDMAAMAKAKP